MVIFTIASAPERAVSMSNDTQLTYMFEASEQFRHHPLLIFLGSGKMGTNFYTYETRLNISAQCDMEMHLSGYFIVIPTSGVNISLIKIFCR